jgi:hypothetical protein
MASHASLEEEVPARECLEPTLSEHGLRSTVSGRVAPPPPERQAPPASREEREHRERREARA